MKVMIDVPGVSGASKGTRVELDDHDVAAAVSRVSVNVSAEDLTTVELRLAVVNGAHFAGEAKVQLDGPTRAVLKQLGWTPPSDAPSDAGGLDDDLLSNDFAATMVDGLLGGVEPLGLLDEVDPLGYANEPGPVLSTTPPVDGLPDAQLAPPG